MKRLLPWIATVGLVFVAPAACLRVVHERDIIYVVVDGGTTPVLVPYPCIPTNPTRHAQVLYAMNLERSAANLAGSYASTVSALHQQLAAQNVVVDEFAVAPIYGGVNGAPQLVYGRSAGLAGGGDLTAVLSAAALSGNYDKPLPGVTAEQYNLATLAAHLDTATLPPAQNFGQARSAFTLPRDIFLVVTIQPTRRSCADTDAACLLAGPGGPLAPAAYFAASDGNGDAAWLKLPGGTMPSSHVFQLFIATSETETPADFQATCGAVPAFPQTFLYVLEPSPVPYYSDLNRQLGQSNLAAQMIDFCDVLGANSDTVLRAVAAEIEAINPPVAGDGGCEIPDLEGFVLGGGGDVDLGAAPAVGLDN